MPVVMMLVKGCLRLHETGTQLAETQLYWEVYTMIEMWRRGPLDSPRHLVLLSDWCIYCRQNCIPRREYVFKSDPPPRYYVCDSHVSSLIRRDFLLRQVRIASVETPQVSDSGT